MFKASKNAGLNLFLYSFLKCDKVSGKFIFFKSLELNHLDKTHLLTISDQNNRILGSEAHLPTMQGKG